MWCSGYVSRSQTGVYLPATGIEEEEPKAGKYKFHNYSYVVFF